jgi:RNA polymerase sigma-70 factor (ECF subfamily)
VEGRQPKSVPEVHADVKLPTEENTANDPVDVGLIARAVRGDQAACSLLYRRHYAMLMPICMRYAKDGDEAKDILQEGFVRIFSNLAAFSGKGAFLGWLKRVMINTAINRSVLRIEHLDQEDVQFGSLAHEDVFSKFSVNELLDLVRGLSPIYRMVFNLRVIEGWSHEEIAKEMGISVATSKSNLHRARANLMNRLVRHDPCLINQRRPYEP